MLYEVITILHLNNGFHCSTSDDIRKLFFGRTKITYPGPKKNKTEQYGKNKTACHIVSQGQSLIGKFERHFRNNFV